MYSEEQIARLKGQLRDHLLYFGYTNNPTEGEENDTAFFQFDDFEEGDICRFKCFETSNKRVLAEIGKVSEGPKPEFEFNNGGFMKLNLLKAPMPFTQVSFEPHEDGL